MLIKFQVIAVLCRSIRWLVWQSTVLGMAAARHYAAAITLLRGLDDSPVDPATLAGADVPTLVALDEARHVTLTPCGRSG